MVETRCIFCGSVVMDASPNMSDLANWYAINYPDLPVHASVPDVCSYCGFDYEIGSLVSLRNSDSGEHYTVIGHASLRSRGTEYQPKLIAVQDSKGNLFTFAKTQIQPSHENKLAAESENRNDVVNDEKKDGYF